jgi:hypothetical protein
VTGFGAFDAYPVAHATAASALYGKHKAEFDAYAAKCRDIWDRMANDSVFTAWLADERGRIAGG